MEMSSMSENGIGILQHQQAGKCRKRKGLPDATARKSCQQLAAEPWQKAKKEMSPFRRTSRD